MKTVVTAPLRITVESHMAIKKKSHTEMVTQESVIRKILHEWALKQNQKRVKKEKKKIPICPICLVDTNVVPINDIAFGCHECGKEFQAN